MIGYNDVIDERQVLLERIAKLEEELIFVVNSPNSQDAKLVKKKYKIDATNIISNLKRIRAENGCISMEIVKRYIKNGWQSNN